MSSKFNVVCHSFIMTYLYRFLYYFYHSSAIESTHVKDSSKLIKLFALCAVAFAWSVKAGAIKNEIAPIKIKSHKRPAFSLFTYGFQAMQTWMFKSRLTPLLKKLVKLLVTDLLRVT